MRLLLLLLCLVFSTLSLECFNCGVFLSAASPECRGPPTNTSCAPENIGCMKLIGQNSDGTFYVEKRCAEKNDDRSEGCREIGIRGIKATECLCKGSFCNSSPVFSMLTMLSLLPFFHCLW